LFYKYWVDPTEQISNSFLEDLKLLAKLSASKSCGYKPLWDNLILGLPLAIPIFLTTPYGSWLDNFRNCFSLVGGTDICSSFDIVVSLTCTSFSLFGFSILLIFSLRFSKSGKEKLNKEI